MIEIDYCTCENSSSTYTEIDDFGMWDVCVDCNKPIEDTYEYFNPSENEFESYDDSE